ncbi:MAG: Maf family protein [Actinomycetes bacterium]
MARVRAAPLSVRLVLASASPGRLSVLRAAGVEPEVVVSGVDESDVAGTPAEIAAELARRKAAAVAELPVARGALVLGCDSVLELDGLAHGKPADAADAVRRWRLMRGRQGVLMTGHCLVDRRTDAFATAEAVARTGVSFADLSDAEIEAYVGTGEPMRVAGAFTVDGLGGWFVAGVDGAPSNVVGLSLPLLRDLLAEVGVGVADLWPGRPAFANR